MHAPILATWMLIACGSEVTDEFSQIGDEIDVQAGVVSTDMDGDNPTAGELLGEPPVVPRIPPWRDRTRSLAW